MRDVMLVAAALCFLLSLLGSGPTTPSWPVAGGLALVAAAICHHAGRPRPPG